MADQLSHHQLSRVLGFLDPCSWGHPTIRQDATVACHGCSRKTVYQRHGSECSIAGAAIPASRYFDIWAELILGRDQDVLRC